jgi:putative lipoic acid-binding regulatory protein
VTAQEPPKIEFPCDYPVKVLGRQVDHFHETVVAVVERHDPGFDQSLITVRDSRKGNFVAITVVITATGPEQLKALHEDLMQTGLVQMVI